MFPSLCLSVVWYRLYDVYPVVEMMYQKREEGYAALGGYIVSGLPPSSHSAWVAG